MNLLNCKKGQSKVFIASMVFIFVAGFIFILAFFIYSAFDDGISSTPIYNEDVERVSTSFKNGISWLDNIMVFVLIAIIMATGWSSFKVAAVNVFFVITLIMAPLYGFISYLFNHIFLSMISEPVFTTTLVYFPRTVAICTNLHWVMLCLIVISSITLYAKKPKGQFIE